MKKRRFVWKGSWPSFKKRKTPPHRENCECQPGALSYFSWVFSLLTDKTPAGCPGIRLYYALDFFSEKATKIHSIFNRGIFVVKIHEIFFPTMTIDIFLHNGRFLAIVIMLLAMFFGSSCAHRENPYREFDSWALRQNAIPRYFAKFDVFYLAPTFREESSAMENQWRYQQFREQLYNYSNFHLVQQGGNTIRFFVPFVHQLPLAESRQALLNSPKENAANPKLEAAIEDAVQAFRHYYHSYHRGNRPFFIAGQGQGALLAYEVLRRCPEIRPENGFVAAYLVGMPGLQTRKIRLDLGNRGIAPGEGETDIGVVLGWCVPNAGEVAELPPDSERYVINPLNWSRYERSATALPVDGSVFYDGMDADPLRRQMTIPGGYLQSQIDLTNGVLRVKPITVNPAVEAFVKKQHFVYNDLGLFSGAVLRNMHARADQCKYLQLWKKNRK